MGPRLVDPAATSPEARRRLSGPAPRTFKTIADRRDTSEAERLRVLDQPSRATYDAWMARAEKGEAPTLSLDTLLRLSAILGIFEGLAIPFEDGAEAVRWLRGPHRGLPFAGQAPMDLMLSGTQDGLPTVRRYLDA